jgi:hypothetical protein
LRPRLASADARFSSALRRALAISFCVFSNALARCSSSFLCGITQGDPCVSESEPFFC